MYDIDSKKEVKYVLVGIKYRNIYRWAIRDTGNLYVLSLQGGVLNV